jgi:hypothetical protein
MSDPEVAKRLAPRRPDIRVLCMSRRTDDSIVRHGVLEAHLRVSAEAVHSADAGEDVREVLDSAGAG